MKHIRTQAYLGPNRRSDLPLVEMVVQAQPEELDALPEILDHLDQRLPPLLRSLGVRWDSDQAESGQQPDAGAARFAALFNRLALVLQRHAGHQVDYAGFFSVADPESGVGEHWYMLFGHDDPQVGEHAGDLTLCVMAECSGTLRWQPVFYDPVDGLRSCLSAFATMAEPLVAPPETLELLAAAQSRGIPSLRLERKPFEPLQAPLRVAPNGLVMLGHGCHQVVLDGLFCLSRPGPAFTMMSNRQRMWAWLAESGFPVPPTQLAELPCRTLQEAREVATKRGFPLRLYPLRRDPGFAGGWQVDDQAMLEQRYRLSHLEGRACLAAPLAGLRTLDLLVAGGTTVVRAEQGVAQAVDPELADLARRIARQANAGLLRLSLALPAEEADRQAPVHVADLDASPAYSRLLAGDPEARRLLLDSFLDWLFPPGRPHSVPIFAITGTNGKTTTSTMIAEAWQAHGRNVGLSQTEGVFLNGQRLVFDDLAGFPGHCDVLANAEVEVAVLETARGGLAALGLAFSRCDVAVCTNVTEDHLGEYGIHTVDELAELKRLPLERAGQAVVLNADDAHCMDMLPYLHAASVCLFSRRRPARELLRPAGPANACCVLESVDGAEWLVYYDRDGRQPLLRSDAIPASRGGKARFNVWNAQAAAGACIQGGLPADVVVGALGVFQTGPRNVPGRLNQFTGLPYDLLIDHGHNPAAIGNLLDYVGQLPSTGRRILLLPGMRNRQDRLILAVARRVAGHFDHYVLSNYRSTSMDDLDHIPTLLRQGLLESGVDEADITIVREEMPGVRHAMDLAQPGDLLVMVLGHEAIEETLQELSRMGARAV